VGLVPIVEPEVDIHCPEKAKAETLLKAAILDQLNKLPPGQLVMLKITLPEQSDFYADCVSHPNVLKVVALSGGYSLKKAMTAFAGITVSWRASRERWWKGCRSSNPMRSITLCWMQRFRASMRRPTLELAVIRNRILNSFIRPSMLVTFVFVTLNPSADLLFVAHPVLAKILL
jgi:hypothetical protein